jgi:hypothetical protein
MSALQSMMPPSAFPDLAPTNPLGRPFPLKAA